MNNERRIQIIGAIKNGYISEAELLEYVTDNDLEIAVAATQSDKATEPLLDIAAHDRDYKVRLTALNNKNTGERTLIYLCNDVDEGIRERAKEILGERKNEMVL